MSSGYNLLNIQQTTKPNIEQANKMGMCTTIAGLWFAVCSAASGLSLLLLAGNLNYPTVDW